MTKPLSVFLNGRIVTLEEARISPLDRGFQLGDGVFETLRAYRGRPFTLDEHLARLRESCRVTRLPFPEDLPTAVSDVLKANGFPDAAIRITVTRGPGGRGASPQGAGPATVLVTVMPVAAPPAIYEMGVRLITSRRRRVSRDALEPGIKSIDYLVHVLARIEAEDAGADDALFIDDQGLVVEATQANLFMVHGYRLVTPPLASGCLPGVTRTVVLRQAQDLGLTAQETDLPRAALLEADEVFLTASVSEIVPVVALDGVRIGTGKPGATTRRVHERYRLLASA